MTLLGKHAFSKGLSGVCLLARCRSGTLVGGSAGTGGGVPLFLPQLCHKEPACRRCWGPVTPSSVLSACKAFPTHIPTTFSPTCHTNRIFSAPVPGALWTLPTSATPALLSLWNGFL